jgi:hypothetical protein
MYALLQIVVVGIFRAVWRHPPTAFTGSARFQSRTESEFVPATRVSEMILRSHSRRIWQAPDRLLVLLCRLVALGTADLNLILPHADGEIEPAAVRIKRRAEVRRLGAFGFGLIFLAGYNLQFRHVAGNRKADSHDHPHECLLQTHFR